MCHTALRSWPNLTDYVWVFLQFHFLGIDPKTKFFCQRTYPKVVEVSNHLKKFIQNKNNLPVNTT